MNFFIAKFLVLISLLTGNAASAVQSTDQDTITLNSKKLDGDSGSKAQGNLYTQVLMTNHLNRRLSKESTTLWLPFKLCLNTSVIPETPPSMRFKAQWTRVSFYFSSSTSAMQFYALLFDFSFNHLGAPLFLRSRSRSLLFRLAVFWAAGGCPAALACTGCFTVPSV